MTFISDDVADADGFYITYDFINVTKVTTTNRVVSSGQHQMFLSQLVHLLEILHPTPLNEWCYLTE